VAVEVTVTVKVADAVFTVDIVIVVTLVDVTVIVDRVLVVFTLFSVLVIGLAVVDVVDVCVTVTVLEGIRSPRQEHAARITGDAKGARIIGGARRGSTTWGSTTFARMAGRRIEAALLTGAPSRW